jgi:hypothetical protein
MSCLLSVPPPPIPILMSCSLLCLATTHICSLCPAYPLVLLPLIPVLMSCSLLCPATIHICSLCPTYPLVLLPPIPVLMSCYHSYLFLVSCLLICPAMAHICSLCPAYLCVLLRPVPAGYFPCTRLSCSHPYLFLMSCYDPYLFLMSCLPMCPATTGTCWLCPVYSSVLLPPISIPYVPPYPYVLLQPISISYVLLRPISVPYVPINDPQGSRTSSCLVLCPATMRSSPPPTHRGSTSLSRSTPLPPT